jgi:hypothetical protein
VLVRTTRTADANLDGIVNDDDVTIVGAFYAPGVPNPHWALGDFDYNGFVDDDDVTQLGAIYAPTAAPQAPPALLGGGFPPPIIGTLDVMTGVAKLASAAPASGVDADTGAESATYLDASESPNLVALLLADLRSSQVRTADDATIELLAGSLASQGETESVNVARSARSAGRKDQVAESLWAQW